ncbi:aspartate/glutamate racemase family protein [Desulfotignum phosphitoxidans]|uniref:aspartate/glutamate racemase family protein n=1 Tax=Desulfotignum phosphitoxidans TaxID=190898 RepID=UPI000A059033|nr:aspartate/glutamate racemase family protein [Desulfotignum phosphitoxidans]
MCLGIAKHETREKYLRIIDTLAKQGAEAIILGCTEIGMLVGQKDTPVKLFDTTAIHAQKAVQYAMRRF